MYIFYPALFYFFFPYLSFFFKEEEKDGYAANIRCPPMSSVLYLSLSLTLVVFNISISSRGDQQRFFSNVTLRQAANRSFLPLLLTICNSSALSPSHCKRTFIFFFLFLSFCSFFFSAYSVYTCDHMYRKKIEWELKKKKLNVATWRKSLDAEKKKRRRRDRFSNLFVSLNRVSVERSCNHKLSALSLSFPSFQCEF